MSTKYIGQINNTSFVYPNKTLAEYDIDIVHDLNDNSVSGFSTTFSATTITTSSITVSYNLTWVKNGAEPFINNAGLLSAISIHMLAPGQSYYKPWRVVHSLTSSNTTGSTINFTGSFSVAPADLGLSLFGPGEMYFEIRFIGHRSILPICYSASSGLAPTPTPTPGPTSTPTPTPTATPIGPTPTPTPTATAAPPAYNYYTFTPCAGGGSTDYRSILALALNDVYAFSAGPAVACYTITSITAGVNTNDLPTLYGPKTGCGDTDCIQP